jgi:hypothetical protein
VLTNKFFVFLIFLFGESARLRPGSVASGLAKRSLGSMDSRVVSRLVRKDFSDDSGSCEVGDSGDELGEGSVSAESRVDIVVVGDDSADSKVEAESRRIIGDEKWELGDGLLATFTVLFDAEITKPSAAIDRCTSAPFPKTDIKDGNDASNDCELVVIGMFKCSVCVDQPWFGDVIGV